MFTVFLILIFVFAGLLSIYFLFSRDSVQEKINRAIEFIDSNNIDSALAILQNISSKNKDIPLIHWLLADIYFKKQLYEPAIDECEKILALKKFSGKITEAEVRKKLGAIYIENKKLDNAYQELLLVSKLNPDDAEINLELAKLSIERKVYRDAIMYADKYIKFNSNNSTAYFLLGQAYFFSKSLEAAEINFTKSLNIDSHNNLAHYYLGLIYASKNEYDKALTEFQYPQSDKAAQFDIAFQKGKILHSKGMYDNSITELKKAIKLGTDNRNDIYEIKYLLGDIYTKQNNVDEALKYWEALYKENPKYKDIKERYNIYKELRETDIISKIMRATNEEFIKICYAIVESMEYKIVEHDLRKDGILDIIAYDKEAESTKNYLIEIIRSETEIGELTLREMNSKMQDLQAYNGICITTSTLTDAAKEYVENRSIDIIDKERLKNLISKKSIKL